MMKFCFAASASLLCAQAAAQTQAMYKCKDAAGKITYTGSECHLLGLTSAGEVTGRASVTPALKFDPPAPSTALRPAPATAEAPAPPAPPADADSASGKRCFVVKTAKGTATRCNDTPDPADTPATPATPDKPN